MSNGEPTGRLGEQNLREAVNRNVALLTRQRQSSLHLGRVVELRVDRGELDRSLSLATYLHFAETEKEQKKILPPSLSTHVVKCGNVIVVSETPDSSS